MSGVFPREPLLRGPFRVARVRRIAVDYFWPNTMAGDGLPVRGTRFVDTTDTPLRVFDHFVTASGHKCRILRAYVVGDPLAARRGIDAVMMRELHMHPHLR